MLFKYFPTDKCLTALCLYVYNFMTILVYGSFSGLLP